MLLGKLAVAVPIMLTCAAGSASAASLADYRICDGYGAAASGGDGMTEAARVAFIFNPVGYGNTDRSVISKDANGAAAGCTAALADLEPKWWMRKVSLLRARAMHRLSAQDISGAKADLELAEAAVQPGNPYFDRSLGLGLAMTRAYWMIKSGDRPGGEALAMSILAQRPYNRQIISSAMEVVGADASDEDRQVILQDISRLMPDRTMLLYLQAFDGLQFEQVIALRPQLVPPVEVSNESRETEKVAVAWRNFRRQQAFLALTDGMYAYALAAKDREAEAQSVLSAARERLTKETEAPLPLLSAKESRDREMVAIHDGWVAIRQRVAAENRQVLDSWATQVDRRNAISSGQIDQLLQALPQAELPVNASSQDILDALTDKIPPGKRPATPLSADMRLKLAAQDKPYRFKNASPQQLLASLPEAEIADRVPPYEESVRPFLAMEGSQADLDEEGFRVSTPNPDGSISVSFRGLKASESMVEEMTLLRAADLARKAGKRGVAILDRRDVRHSLTTTTYGVPVRSDPRGYSCSLTVRFLDMAELPPNYLTARWRLLDADQVYDVLAPLYILSPKAKR